MSRRFITALLLALPFIAVGVVAYADWQNPPLCQAGQTCPPDNNLPGPVWLLDPSDARPAQAGKLNLSGTAFSGSVSTGLVSATPANGDAVFGSTSTPTYAAIHGFSLNDPAWGPNWAGAWAGYFDGKLFAKEVCIGPGPNTCSMVASNSLWTLAADGHTIYKTDLTGKVGIGTATPSENLEVTSAGRSILSLRGDPTANWVGTVLRDTTGAEKWFVGSNGGNLLLRRNATTNDVVVTSGGNVGIGTTSPGGTLSVNSTYTGTSRTGNLFITSANNTNQKLYVGINSNGGAITGDYASIEYVQETQHWGPLVLQADGGSVGIGTTSPVEKLDAAGSFRLAGSYGTLMRSGTFGSNTMDTNGDGVQEGATNDKWIKFGELTLSTPWGPAGVFIDLYPTNACCGDARQQVSVQVRNDSADLELWSMDISLLTLIDGQQAQVKDVKLVRKTGSAGLNNVMAIWIQMKSTWLSTVPITVQYYGTASLNLTNQTPYASITDAGTQYSVTTTTGGGGGGYWTLAADGHTIYKTDTTGSVGIGTIAPNAKLSVTTTGTELGGTAASAALRIMAGALGATSGNTLKLASFGFTSGNNTSLGVEALRTAAGADWTTTAIGLKFDVDNTSSVNGAQIWLANSGNVGVGVTAPQSSLDVGGTNPAVTFRGWSPGTVTVSSFTATPSSGTAPLNGVSLTATVGGTATGTIQYQFDCTNDGIFELDTTSGATPYTASSLCNYASSGTYTASVTVTRNSTQATGTATITVSAPVTVALSAVPSTKAAAPLTSTLTATVGGSATGNIRYQFYCRAADVTPIKDETIASTTDTAVCTYSSNGSFTPRVTVTRGGNPPVTNTTSICVGPSCF